MRAVLHTSWRASCLPPIWELSLFLLTGPDFAFISPTFVSHVLPGVVTHPSPRQQGTLSGKHSFNLALGKSDCFRQITDQSQAFQSQWDWLQRIWCLSCGGSQGSVLLWGCDVGAVAATLYTGGGWKHAYVWSLLQQADTRDAGKETEEVT